jgi:hypothetical protein
LRLSCSMLSLEAMRANERVRALFRAGRCLCYHILPHIIKPSFYLQRAHVENGSNFQAKQV